MLTFLSVRYITFACSNCIHFKHEYHNTCKCYRKDVLMHDLLEHMKATHRGWYDYFIKENYDTKLYHRCDLHPGMPITTNACEKSHDVQKVCSNINNV